MSSSGSGSSTGGAGGAGGSSSTVAGSTAGAGGSSTVSGAGAGISPCQTPGDCATEAPLDGVSCSCPSGRAPAGGGALLVGAMTLLAALGRRRDRGRERADLLVKRDPSLPRG